MSQETQRDQNKRLIHEGCGGRVSRRNLVCAKCQTRPPGDKIVLIKKKVL